MTRIKNNFTTHTKLLLLLCLMSTSLTTVFAEDIKITDLQKPEVSKAIPESVPDSKEQTDTIAEQPVLHQTQNLTPEAALKIALTAKKSCRDSGYQVSVAIVDNGGHLQVVLRDKLAGIKTPDIAISKARTAISFKSSTSALNKALVENKHLNGVKHMPGILFLAGGVPITASGIAVAAIGVSGAPDAKFDERCALIGIKSIEHKLIN